MLQAYWQQHQGFAGLLAANPAARRPSGSERKVFARLQAYWQQTLPLAGLAAASARCCSKPSCSQA
eukprot:4115508-Lingulodinium_polyedra.AAC.1